MLGSSARLLVLAVGVGVACLDLEERGAIEWAVGWGVSGSGSGLIATWFGVWLGSSSSSKSMMIFPRVLRSLRVVRLGGGSVKSPSFFRNLGLRLRLDLSLGA